MVESPFKRIGILIKPDSPVAMKAGIEIARWFSQKGFLPLLDARAGEAAAGLNVDLADEEELCRKADLVICLGGDGTLIFAAHYIGEGGIPILSVNAGRMGFLTEISWDNSFELFEQLIAGRFSIEERKTLDVHHLREGRIIHRMRAINEAVVTKGALARMIELDLAVDGKYVTTYHADGMILSTPTGSTAYSMSAGGPIIFPTVEAILITPICPHTLTNRPILLPPQSKAAVSLPVNGHKVFLTVDGRPGCPVAMGDRVEVSLSKYPLRLVRLARNDFFQVLRAKLKWGER
jgi:NAD+ kinase